MRTGRASTVYAAVRGEGGEKEEGEDEGEGERRRKLRKVGEGGRRDRGQGSLTLEGIHSFNLIHTAGTACPSGWGWG